MSRGPVLTAGEDDGGRVVLSAFTFARKTVPSRYRLDDVLHERPTAPGRPDVSPPQPYPQNDVRHIARVLAAFQHFPTHIF